MKGTLGVPYPNAFTINKLGGVPYGPLWRRRLLRSAGFFPLTASVSQESTIYGIDVCAVAISDIAELLLRHSQDSFVAYDIDHNVFSPDGSRILELREAIQKLGLKCRMYNNRMIAFTKDQLELISTRLNHFNFHMFDLPHEASAELAAEMYPLASGYNSETPLLAVLSDSTVYLDSHDDCYLHLETREKFLPTHVLARVLMTYVAAVVGKRRRKNWGKIPEPSSALVERICPLNGAITVLREETKVDQNGLVIGYSDQRFDFGEKRTYPSVGKLVCNLAGHSWSVVP